MKRSIIILIVLGAVYLSATKVIFINNAKYSQYQDKESICFFLMQQIYKRLGMEFEYIYLRERDALAMIESQENVIAFPVIKQKFMSIKLYASNPFYTSSDNIYFNNKKTPNLEAKQLSDLKDYVVGSSESYSNEVQLRKSGLVVHYSNDNLESFRKLINQEIDIVVDEKHRGHNYLKRFTADERNDITTIITDLFPEYLYIIALKDNKDAKDTINKINDLIADEDYYAQLLDDFFSNYSILTTEE